MGVNKITILGQLKAILLLKFIQAIRDKKFIFSGVLIPLVGVGLSLLFNFLNFTSGSDSTVTFTPVNNVNLTYNPSTSLGETPIINTMKSMFDVDFLEITEQQMTNDIFNYTLSDQIGGYSFNDTKDNLTFTQTIFFNSSSIIPNLNQNLYISIYNLVSNKTLKIVETLTPLGSGNTGFQLFPFIGPILIQYTFIFFVPYFAINIVVERSKGIKYHLFLNSLRSKVYWGGYLLADFILYLAPATIGWFALTVAKVDGFYTNPVGSFFLFFCFGLSAIPFGYIIQFAFDKEDTASKWLYSLASIISTVPSTVISFAAPNGVPRAVTVLLSFLPACSLFNGLSDLVRGQDTIITTIIVQLASCVLYLFVIYIIERIKNRPSKVTVDDVELNQGNTDQDVLDERQRVQQSTQPNSGHKYVITVDGIFKHFVENLPDDKSGYEKKRVKAAVDGIWFGVESGQCFGLLGHNGAGKTTLVNIMTGILNCDRGDGFIDRFSISKERESSFSSVGSCPQTDILFDNLTIREHLQLFSSIKGASKEDSQVEINYFIEKFRIAEHADKKSKELSGGTKRKLSVACCLVGSPRIVFLDEASSGLDPSSRRHLWEIIQEMKPGKAIILISHSMDEVDFLANRIGIMCNGRLRCIGTPSHLKHKFGSGYTLDIQPRNFSDTPNIINYIKNSFPEAVFIEKLGIITFELPTSDNFSLAKIFRVCEVGKQQVGIVDFNVSETSLEKVFLKLAVEQSNAEDHDKILEKKKHTIRKKNDQFQDVYQIILASTTKTIK
ncbi:ABC transporter A family protein [Cavenderia fasciculata]|uniref:ABC transporter A family protein n=1 Tax=Cavenderia fasciculata TaxID=261658 RepID=F4PN50_CACFS|nr:ABC transporter A family protein [Cavenderia fasciculata]EGG23740.1 ABC transporter A family protein [Cavenderia fasciculata]|eukprot:XP_004361591.1 ABC transporter A family protein [Cavenderia fasciculata]